MEALLSAFGIVLLAELGDKSMLLSLTAATRFRWWVVLIPVVVATAVLMGLAVVVGGLAGEFLPERLIALVAAALFIGFGVWTLRSDDDDDEGDLSTTFRSPVRVMLALGLLFFASEFGDKTQIATLSLAGLHSTALAPLVWLGATVGMVASNALGIFVGARLNRLLPVRVIRIAAGVAFIGFGVMAVTLAFV
jgi:Ca2+/H+ antiporter, TMEM165/GDT1 family